MIISWFDLTEKALLAFAKCAVYLSLRLKAFAQ